MIKYIIQTANYVGPEIPKRGFYIYVRWTTGDMDGSCDSTLGPFPVEEREPLIELADTLYAMMYAPTVDDIPAIPGYAAWFDEDEPFGTDKWEDLRKEIFAQTPCREWYGDWCSGPAYPVSFEIRYYDGNNPGYYTCEARNASQDPVKTA